MASRVQWFPVDSIVGHQRHGALMYYRVRWAGYGPQHDTWEPEPNLVADGLANYIERHHALEALMWVLAREAKKRETATCAPTKSKDSCRKSNKSNDVGEL